MVLNSVSTRGWAGSVLGLAVLALAVGGCANYQRPRSWLPRQGDEIVIAGRFFHTGTPVVLWMDPGGYDGYRVERRFSAFNEASWETSKVAVSALSSPNRFNLRNAKLTSEQLEQVRGGGWDLPLLQSVVDQFVIHFDVTGTSRQCFKVLHDVRGLSVHFMLDLDGTIYQTLDLKERAWHATSSNSRSVGIEIANVGAYAPDNRKTLDEWYRPDADGKVRIIIPERLGEPGIRTAGFIGRPARPEPIVGRVQGQELAQYDLTPEQYRTLTRLTAALCSALPKIRCDYPKDSEGKLIPVKLPNEELEKYQGILGHYHVQLNKVDPGPAFQWDTVIDGARRLMRSGRKMDPEKAATKLLDF